MTARRRPARPNPSLRQIGRALAAPVRAHRRVREWATGYEATMRKPSPKAEPARRRPAPAPDARKTAHEERMRQLRETKEMRAAAILWHRQEYYRARAETERAKAERAKTADARRSSGAKADTATRKADDFERMTREAEAGRLTGDQLRYYIDTYSTSGRKRA